MNEARAACNALNEKINASSNRLERVKQQLELLQSEPHISEDAFYNAELASFQADSSLAAVDSEDHAWQEWYKSFMARWQKTPVGRAEKRVRDLRHEKQDAWTAWGDAGYAHSQLEMALRARRDAESVESEEGDSEDEEGGQLARMQAEMDELRAENRRLRAALMQAHASGVRADVCHLMCP